MKDQLFQNPMPAGYQFEFNEEVAQVFDDMLERSIPLYHEMLRLTQEIVWRYAQPQTAVYDLGCSTGTLLSQLIPSCSVPVTWIGVDASTAVLQKAEQRLMPFLTSHSLKLVASDLLNFSFDNASVVILNYTLQFLPVHTRLEFLKKLWKALTPGGVLILSEKTQVISPEIQAFQSQSYDDFKRKNGYSDTEIIQKREALQSVLFPLSCEENKNFLENAGFSTIELLLKWQQFTTWLVLK